MIDIYKIKRKTFDIDLFMDTFLIYEHKKIVDILVNLENEGLIKPIKSSSLTVKYPQVYTKYKICEIAKEVDANIENEINFTLNNKIKIDYIRNNIDEYVKHRNKILLISNFLNDKNNLDVQVSINERSYEIFGEEKYLSSKEGKELLGKLGLSVIEDLNVYLTPEPFFYSSLNTKKGQTILIVENKDTYITMLKVLNCNSGFVFNKKIDTLIYGEGKKIISSLNSIYEDSNLSYLNDECNNFLYWGDIDKEGFYIFGLIKRHFPNVNIELFEDAYKKMFLKFNTVSKIKSKCSKEQAKGYMIGLNYLSEGLKNDIGALLENGYYIPQEILTIKDLRVCEDE